MKTNRKKNIIIALTVSWILLVFFGILFFRTSKKKILEDERLDLIPTFQDTQDYSFSLNASLDTDYSDLYKCKSDSIPEYLNDLAQSIDKELEREESKNFVRWMKGQREVIVYSIDSTVLNLYLDQYPERIDFTSVENFIREYLDPQIEHFDIQVQIEGDIEIYTSNRVVDEKELITGYGYSDFFHIKNGYLTSARVLLANISKTEYSVPLINNLQAIETYINTDYYPKNIIMYTSDIVEVDPYSYEDFDPEFSYEKCLINDIVPKLYFSSCNQNYIYYSYKIDGTCDITYENKLYAVPFRGFINAIDPEYVKSSD